MFAEIRGTKIYYEVVGEGEPLFLLPGGPGADSRVYKKHHMPLAKENKLVLFDPRGCGQSPACDPEKYDIDEYVSDVEALRLHLGFDKINVLGKSYGGNAAQAYVLRYPDAINKLILVVTNTSYRFKKIALKNLQKLATPEQLAWGEKMLAGEIANQDEIEKCILMLQGLYSTSTKKELQENADAQWDVNIAHGPYQYGFQHFLNTFDFEPWLHTIQQQTLIIGGEQDWVCDPLFSYLLHEKITHSILRMFDVGHAVDSDATEEYIESIETFLR